MKKHLRNIITKKFEDFGIEVMILMKDFLAERINKKQCLKKFNLLIKNYSMMIEKELEKKGGKNDNNS